MCARLFALLAILMTTAGCSEGYSDLVDPKDPHSWRDTVRTGTYRAEERYVNKEPYRPAGWGLSLKLGCIGIGQLSIITYIKSEEIKGGGFMVRSCPDQKNWVATLFGAEGSWSQTGAFTLSTALDTDMTLSYQGHPTSTGLLALMSVHQRGKERVVGDLTATWVDELDSAAAMAITAAVSDKLPDRTTLTPLLTLLPKTIDPTLPFDCTRYPLGWVCASR